MRNVKIDEVDRLDRDVVALGNDYAQGFILPPHQHRRAQLLYGATGLMYVTTQDGEWVVPPQHAVWIPPETVHAVRFAGVTTRSLYIEPDCVAAFIKHRRCEVISVSPLLRQLLLEAVDLPPLSASFSPEKSMVISSNWVGLFPSLLILSVTEFVLLLDVLAPTPVNVPSFVLKSIA